MRRVAILLLLGWAACGTEGTREVKDTGAGSTAVATQEAPRIEAKDIKELLRDGDLLFLDVREPQEIEELGTIEGYMNIPVDQLEGRLDEVPRDKPILTA
jgi:predicted sulfurtransferase